MSKTNKQNSKIGMVYNPVLMKELDEKFKKAIYMNHPKSGQDAYNKVASYLIKNAKDIDNADEAFEKHAKQLEELVGIFAPAVDMMIRVYYNVEDFVADGEPMDQVWADIEDMKNENRR